MYLYSSLNRIFMTKKNKKCFHHTVMCLFLFSFLLNFQKTIGWIRGHGTGFFLYWSLVRIRNPAAPLCTAQVYLDIEKSIYDFSGSQSAKTLTGFSYQQIFDIFTSMLPSLPLQKGTLQSVLRIRIYYYADPDPGPKKCPYGSEGIKTKEEKLHTKNVQLNLSN